MSSTNRKNSSERHISDYYITPIKTIELFLEKFLQIEGNIFSFVLDPCAGGDSSNPMSYPSALENLIAEDIITMDIREDSPAQIKEDYLQVSFDFKFDVIITNPPFYIAQEIIEKSFEDIEDNGYVIMLLRLNFLGSQKRKPFWDRFPPKYIFVHSKRISFFTDPKGNSVTDSVEYAHFVWQKGWQQPSILYII